MSDNTYPLIAVLVIPGQPTRGNNPVFITWDKKEVYHRAAFSLGIYKCGLSFVRVKKTHWRPLMCGKTMR